MLPEGGEAPLPRARRVQLMVKLQEILLRNVERLRIALGTLSDARLKDAPEVQRASPPTSLWAT